MTVTEQARADRAADGSAPPTPRRLGWLYIIAGGIGLIAAFALTLEKLAKLADPDHVPSCTLNPVLSCSSVMDSPQATAFGFPNPLIGIAGFAVTITVGVVLLCGFRPPRWFWLGMQAGTTFGIVFVHWLIYSSLYQIGALCPYCMVVWVVTIPIFLYTTRHNLTRGNLTPGRRPALVDLARHHLVILTIWYLTIAALILQAFWYYWRTLI